MYPDCNTILKLAPEYDILPVSREIYADETTPIALLRKITAVSRRCFLLESVEGGENWGRYSFLGMDPVMRVSCKAGEVTVEEKGSSQKIRTRDPAQVLREILAVRRSPRLEGMPPFTGGFVGYFAYSMIGYAEPLLFDDGGKTKDFDLMLFDQVIAYDHLRQKITLIVNLRTDQVMENYGKATAHLEKLAALVRGSSVPARQENPGKVHFSCNIGKEEYCRMVEKAKEKIRDGEIFQVVLSRKFTSPYAGSLLSAYRVLRTTNPSPYMVYLRMDEEEVMSTSPETLVRLQNGRLITFPVAGSRPRGKTPKEDEALEKELQNDEKELAEHHMLVDLGRNDLGKISRYGSVEVTACRMIHKYSRIMHLCSQVEGIPEDGKDALHAIEAVLPAGTLSGAPKIRACQIIDELEAEDRGIYGGALGYLDFTGNMDTCIAIRMAVKQEGTVTVQAGGGIVADSIPEREYEESANKAAAVIRAVESAGEVLES